MKKPFYITTTLPYVNSVPHMGHALEFIRADAVARRKKLDGFDVMFNTGTDEHGSKVYKKAKESGLDPKVYADQYSAKFRELAPALGLSDDLNFIRTTDIHHVKAAQEFWKIADKNGLIYKKNYSVKYCVGCELEKTESELVDGKCPLHPTQELEVIEEENYFFRFSIFQKPLMDLYGRNPTFVRPKTRLNEIQAFVERGLEDFSVSRLASKMPWGIPVPDDASQVMYVWFDALVNYISAVGWPDDMAKFDRYWVQTGGVVQYCGKDNLRQQAAMWQAMLMAVNLPPSREIIIDGFVTGEGGIKMSKSLGNTVDPLEVVKEYGTDALRYFVLRELAPFEDSPFTLEKFKEAYNAHLANGLGNLVSRVMKMASANGIGLDRRVLEAVSAKPEIKALAERQAGGFDQFNLQEAANAVWELISATDRIVQERQPFKKIKTNRDEAIADIKELVAGTNLIGTMLLPLMPETAARIIELTEKGIMPEEPLFARK